MKEWSPSREEDLLSDHVFSFFGRTVTITSREQFIILIAGVIVATAWAVQQFRRRRVVALQRSAVSDQLCMELARIADALERISNRPADEAIAAASRRVEPSSHTIPLSMFGRERPQG